MATDAPRRFARFVAVPRVRRLALTRIGLAGLAAVLTLAALVVLLELATSWLKRQPDYRLAFREITLDPPPPSWYRGGAAAFLDRVRDGDPSKQAVSVLGIDLEELQRGFRLYCWVERVVRVERSYPNRLVVHLEYRKPVAVARGKVVPGRAKVEPDRVIDKDGVILPKGDIDEEAVNRLISVVDLDPPFDPRPGRVWKSGDSSRGQERGDERVLAAAKLADFLETAQEREKTLPPALQLIAIHPIDKHTLFVQNGPSTIVLWGEAPGSEYPGQLSAEDKWAKLRDWVRANPNLQVESPYFLYLRFTKGEFIIR
ncbi:MAG TPA: hypothetical protein VKP69_02310, partial [Isosphaeraceae bacterium]|nr:hypothetical protein [Isosphaeraceae bacterium]